MTRERPSLWTESIGDESSPQKLNIRAREYTSAVRAPERAGDFSLDAKCAAAGLSSAGGNWHCPDCGLTMSNFSVEQDLVSAHRRASPGCSRCLAPPTHAAGQSLYMTSEIWSKNNSASQSRLQEGLPHDFHAQTASLTSDQLRSLASSFGSIETVPESGPLSFSMTDGGGDQLPPSSHPAPAPLPSLPPPRHPEYSSLESRLASFVGWPERLVGQSPRRLAACGFFYIGSADRVRCFQCGVTLRNWEAEDDPATEHLTWAPDCPVALLPPDTQSQTGFRDVQAPPESGVERGAGEGGEGSGFGSSSRNFEELGVNVSGSDTQTSSVPGHANGETTERDSLTESRSNTTSVTGNVGASSATSNGAAASAAAAAPVPTERDPPSVQAVLELGCSRDTVDRVRERRRREEGTDFPDAPSLFLAVLEEEETQTKALAASAHTALSPHDAPTEGSLPTTPVLTDDASSVPPPVVNGNGNAGPESEARASPSPLSSHTPPGGEARARRRQPRFRQCRLCPQGEVTVTFLPCGHLIACSTCAEKCQVCPRCGKTILGTVKTYFA